MSFLRRTLGSVLAPVLDDRMAMALASPRSPLWAGTRKAWLKTHPTCAACGSRDRPEVHHIQPYHMFRERELDPANLITLCDMHCHLLVGHLANYRSWNPTVVEDAARMRLRIEQRP